MSTLHLFRKNTLVILAAGLAIFLFLSCGRGSGNEPSGEAEASGSELKGSISVSGAFALYPLANVWAEEFRKEHPDVRINISGGGAGKGMADVLGGAVDLGMFSREITQAEKDKGVWWISVTKDAVVPTISASNPQLERIKKEGLTRSELAGIFLVDGKKTWKKSADEVNVYTRSDASGAAAVWAEYLGGAGQESLKGIAVYGDPGVADAVKKDPHAIGFNNIIYVYDLSGGKKYPGIEVAPIDINENGTVDPEENFYGNIKEITNAIAEGKYPSPPARELYFISREAPGKPEVKAFLSWILDKGQGFVEENGYILLSKETIDAQKQKLK